MARRAVAMLDPLGFRRAIGLWSATVNNELPPPGYRIGRYKIESLLGQGGMGAVFAATNEVTGRAVAIKWMLPAMARSTEHVARFLAEARATSRIEHPNVIQVFDVGQDGPAPFLVMERLRGESLADRLKRVGRLTPLETLAIVIPACRGIAEAHNEGIIHRDLKPDNIFLCEGKDGSPRPPKVLDFGISKLYDEQSGQKLTQTGLLMGTPLYMSPEQLAGMIDPDPRFDVYAIGVVLYECLAGRPPFDAESLFGLVHRIAAGEAHPLQTIASDLPPMMTDMVSRAMHAQREIRYPTMPVLLAELERIQGLLEVAAADSGLAAQGSYPASPAFTAPLYDPSPVSSGHLPAANSGTPPLVPASPMSPAPYAANPAVQRGGGYAAPAGSGQSTAMYIIVAILGFIAVMLVVVGGGIAFLVSRSTSPSYSSYGSTPSNDAASPDIGLRFSGTCSPTFAGHVMVMSANGMIIINATQGYNIAGNLTFGFSASAVEEGSVVLSTQGRMRSSETIVNVMQGQRLWTNMGHETGVIMGNRPDPISGRVVISQFDAESSTADLRFENVVLQNVQNEGLCTVDGRLRTYGSVTGY